MLAKSELSSVPLARPTSSGASTDDASTNYGGSAPSNALR